MIDVILYTLAGVALAAPAGLVIFDTLCRPRAVAQPPPTIQRARLTALGPDSGYITIPGAKP